MCLSVDALVLWQRSKWPWLQGQSKPLSARSPQGVEQAVAIAQWQFTHTKALQSVSPSAKPLTLYNLNALLLHAVTLVRLCVVSCTPVSRVYTRVYSVS